VKLTTHLHLVSRLRIVGALPPLPSWRDAYLNRGAPLFVLFNVIITNIDSVRCNVR
jgi:hypothetical protein